MEQKEEYERFTHDENQHLIRVLVIVLLGLGMCSILCAFILPEVAWVLIICFLYVLALEVIFMTSTDFDSPETKELPYPQNLPIEPHRNNESIHN